MPVIRWDGGQQRQIVTAGLKPILCNAYVFAYCKEFNFHQC